MSETYITPSLFESYRWYLKLERSSKEEFLGTLNKEKFEKTEAMKKGILFEDYINHACNGVNLSSKQLDEPYERCVLEIADIVKGGLWQESLYSDININGLPYLLYGRTDVIKRDWIYDIKFSKSYDIGKYKDSIQHLVYMYCSPIKKFSYLISDGTSVFREDYFWDSNSRQLLTSKLSGLMKNIMDNDEFKQAYLNNWKCKHNRKEAA